MSVSRSSSMHSSSQNGLSRSRSAKKKESSKGNVVVSVRIRPEQNGLADGNGSTGEWYVDSQGDEITYHGKDGGAYHYGEHKREKDRET